MMAYWAESQGQSPVYAKYCTVPGPNCTHMYHDRHKATYLPLPLCDQREPSCWSVPGSRTGGILHDYTNWTHPDLAAPAASHFPFGLDNPNKDHPQPQETRGRDRMGGGFRVGPEREYELGTSNEGWQRRWEPGSSSSSLSDSSYRELQAWAARYSHSLPRRRRMGAEMKGAFQEAPETSRTLGRVSRNAPDSHTAALQRTGSYSSGRGPLDVGGQQKTYNPLPVCPPETTVERNQYQRMMFSQPPGYICPPAYDGQHNSSPAMQCYNTLCTDQQGNRKTSYLKSTQPTQNISSDLQDKRGNKEMDTKESQKQRSALDSYSYEDQMQATNNLWQNQPIYSQPSQIQSVSHSSPREVQESKSTEGICSNVIEGRKFKLNQRTGGATIFCLVSRMSGTKAETSRENVETKALPRCTQKSNSEISELEEITKGLRDDNDIIHRVTKLADEVDFSVENLSRIQVEPTIPTRNGDFKTICKDTIGLVESQQAAGHKIESQTGCSLSSQRHFQSTTEKDVGVGDVNPVVGPQVGQTSPVRFPLWREPGYTARMDRNSSLPCRGLVNNSPTRKNSDMYGHPMDIEVRRFEIKEDEKPESCRGQMVIDTTSVLVRMELIPSPKKEHVNYLFHPPYNPPHVDAGIVEPIQTQVNPFPSPDEPEPQTELEEGNSPDPANEDILKAEELQSDTASELCLPCPPQISSPGKETLTARAERILGIPLLDSNTELTCDSVTVPDLCSQNPKDEWETSPLGDNMTDVLCFTEGTQIEMVKPLPDDHADESVCVQDENITQDVSDTEHNEDPEILREGKPEISDCPDSTEDVREDRESQDVKSLGGSMLHEQVSQTDGPEESTEENEPPNEHKACSSPPSDTSSLQPESASESPCRTRHHSLSCEPATETVPPSVFINDASEGPEPSTPTPQGPCSSTSTDVPLPLCECILFPSPGSSTPELPSLTLHCLDSSVHPEDSSSVLEACEEENELDDGLQLTNNDITDGINEHRLEDDTEEPDPWRPLRCDEIADCRKDSITDLVQSANENNKDLTELEEQVARSEDNTTDLESITEVNCLQKLTTTTESLLETCNQEQSNEETEGTRDDARPQSVTHVLDPSIDIKHTVALQPSPFVSEITPSLDTSKFMSDVSDFNSEPALQTDLTSLAASENKALQPEPFLSATSETSPSGDLESHTPLTFLSPAPLDSPPGSPPHQVEVDNVPLEFPGPIADTEESQYPRSLWDAVNRIRKHTAPDSENEDEEVNELWDPQNAAEYLASLHVESEVDVEPEDKVFPHSEGSGKATASSTDHDSSDTEEELVLDGATLLEDSEEERFEDATVGPMEQDEHHEVGLQDEDEHPEVDLQDEDEHPEVDLQDEDEHHEEGLQDEDEHPEVGLQDEDEHPEVDLHDEDEHPEVDLQDEDEHPEVDLQDEDEHPEVDLQDEDKHHEVGLQDEDEHHEVDLQDEDKHHEVGLQDEDEHPEVGLQDEDEHHDADLQDEDEHPEVDLQDEDEHPEVDLQDEDEHHEVGLQDEDEHHEVDLQDEDEHPEVDLQDEDEHPEVGLQDEDENHEVDLQDEDEHHEVGLQDEDEHHEVDLQDEDEHHEVDLQDEDEHPEVDLQDEDEHPEVGLQDEDEHHEVGLQDEGRFSCSNINRHDSEETAVNSAEEVEEKEDIDKNNPDLVKEQETTNDEIPLDEEEKDKCYDKVEVSLAEDDEGGRDETDGVDSKVC